VIHNVLIWLQMMSLCLQPVNYQSCTGFILGEPWIFSRNLWSLFL